MLRELCLLRQLVEDMKNRPFSSMRDAEDFRINAAKALVVLESLTGKRFPDGVSGKCSEPPPS